MSRTLRSRTGLGAGALVALCLSAAAAVAQDRPVTTSTGRADTVKIHLNGRLDMDYVQRDRVLIQAMGVGDDSSSNTIEGSISIRADVELTEKVSGAVEIQRSRMNDGFGGIIPFFGADVDNMIILRDAHLKVSDFMTPGLSVRLGIQNWSFDTRGKGNAFVFSPYNAQSIQKNLDVTVVQDNFGDVAARSGITNAQELEPVGMVVNYKSGALSLDFVILPMIQEGFEPTEDEALYGVDFWYDLGESMGKGSRIGAIVTVSNVPGHESKFITAGLGANLAFSGGLEIYGEGYIQSGAINDAQDAVGHALQIGGRWTGQDGGVWVELNFTLISGEDGGDADHDNFLSYENVNDLLIVEDMYFGFDIDTNYTAVKILAGVLLDGGAGKKNIELALAVGFVTMTEEDPTGDDGIGTEVDVKAKYHLSKQASLSLNVGVLTSSDFLEAVSVDADDATWLASFGFELGF
jgi:hypothetical protein